MARRLAKNYVLMTGGEDKELDAMGVCRSALDELSDGVQIKRILDYLQARYTYQPKSGPIGIDHQLGD